MELVKALFHHLSPTDFIDYSSLPIIPRIHSLGPGEIHGSCSAGKLLL